MDKYPNTRHSEEVAGEGRVEPLNDRVRNELEPIIKYIDVPGEDDSVTASGSAEGITLMLMYDTLRKGKDVTAPGNVIFRNAALRDKED